MEQIATLSELQAYFEKGFSLDDVIRQVAATHGKVKIFDHSPPEFGGLKFRYFVMPLDAKGNPDPNFKEYTCRT